MDFRGVHTAIITPFNLDGKVDEPVLRQLIQRQLDAGVAGIVPCGTTGESPTLNYDEHARVIDIAIEMAKGKALVIAGTGSNATDEAIQLSRHAQQAGADAVLQVNPYYNKPTQLGLFRHFKAIADAIDIPVVLYNIPGRTGVNVETPTLVSLAQSCANIVAVKEASGDLNQIKDVIAATPQPGFAVLSGDDSLTLDLIEAGGHGIISVTSNVLPKKMVEMVKRALAGDKAGSRQLHNEMHPLFRDLFLETNPIPVKTLMSEMGLCREIFRLPLCEFSSSDKRHHLLATAKTLGLL
ncbi:MAG: 4-hydroxy-tetrahydrodipicolinate synthase [Proteobacteria bacterium]|jgi:4-hydroxy-tetrahydrodipicolinate synthase|nr:4-hydroxy-tetrahydrodipicolinate synthase [Pseudomonadota bacterium]NLN61885.1 4-hydroxy-tetrahydrodipicolinate synthase [Myxococcales bacterium]